MTDRYPADLKDRIVELYRQGKKGEDIAIEVGVPRPTVYLILKQRGVAPSRQKNMQSRQLSVEQALEMVAERDRTIGKLDAKIEELERQIAELQLRNAILMEANANRA